MLVSSTGDLCKYFIPKLGFELLDTLMAFCKEYFDKFIFEKNQQTKKACTLPSMKIKEIVQMYFIQTLMYLMLVFLLLKSLEPVHEISNNVAFLHV